MLCVPPNGDALTAVKLLPDWRPEIGLREAARIIELLDHVFAALAATTEAAGPPPEDIEGMSAFIGTGFA
jgi:hypothetical protein